MGPKRLALDTAAGTWFLSVCMPAASIGVVVEKETAAKIVANRKRVVVLAGWCMVPPHLREVIGRTRKIL
jgi:hypothetical protein